MIPEDNKKDLADIPKKVTEDVEIVTVSDVDNVLKIALTQPFKPVVWSEVDPSLSKESKTTASSTLS